MEWISDPQTRMAPTIPLFTLLGQAISGRDLILLVLSFLLLIDMAPVRLHRTPKVEEAG